MALLVLFSTLSFSISEHYCGDNLVDSSLFSEAESCGMEMHEPLSFKGYSIQKNNCCKDVVKLIEGKDNLKANFSDLNVKQQVLFNEFIYSYVNLFEGIEDNIIPFNEYSPPVVIRDIQVLHDTFLI